MDRSTSLQYAERRLDMLTRKVHEQVRFARAVPHGPTQNVALSRLAELLREQHDAEHMGDLISKAPPRAKLVGDAD